MRLEVVKFTEAKCGFVLLHHRPVPSATIDEELVRQLLKSDYI